jgi:HEAT repeat protein
VLKSAQYPEATEPIARVGERRPELAADVVKALGSQNDPAAQAALRKFCSNKDVAVRSAALTGLGTNATAADVLPALNDPASRMRIAAANIVEELLERQRPDSGNSSRNAVGFDWEQWLGDFRSGKGRPEWTNSMAGPLRKMLQSSDPRERLVAAVPLAAFGDADAAKVLNEIAVGEPKERREAASAMQWLPWKERLALFELIKSHSAGDSQVLGVLASDLAKSPDPKAGDALWSLLDDRGADLSVASEIDRSLIRAYTGMDYWNWQPDGGGPQRAKALLEAAKQRAAGGSANQRLVALALLLHASSEDAISAAQPLVASPAMGDGLRTAALQVLLLAQPRPAGVKTAVEQLSGPPPLRKVALAYLAAGADPIQTIQGELYLQFNNPTIQFRTFGEGAPIVIEPPPGVTREMIEPLLKDPDGENVAYASYLLCLLGDRQGLDAVVKWWDGNRSEDYWRRLAYRAISVVGDDNLTPTLEQIYATYDKRMGYDIRDFYWTIRVIKGEKVLKLRKRIRDEVGMDQLR